MQRVIGMDIRRTFGEVVIRENGRFSVNILHAEHRALAETFAGRGGLQGEARFAFGAWQEGAQLGLPVLAGATALECSLDEIVEAGTHAVLLGRVEGAALRKVAPLVYHSGAFRGLVEMEERVAS